MGGFAERFESKDSSKCSLNEVQRLASPGTSRSLGSVQGLDEVQPVTYDGKSYQHITNLEHNGPTSIESNGRP